MHFATPCARPPAFDIAAAAIMCRLHICQYLAYMLSQIDLPYDKFLSTSNIGSKISPITIAIVLLATMEDITPGVPK